MKNQLFGFLLLLSAPAAFSQSDATVKEYQQSFPTYGFSDPNPLPLLSSVYPYFRFDGFTDKATPHSWKVVELENDYIRLLILPEIGGKIWAAIEKSTGEPFIYYNHAVKFRDIAMRGPWTSGGLEANYGIIGHTPNCATPVDYVTHKNADGSVSCTIGTLDLLTRSNWRMEINLPKDKAYFTTRSFWYNSTPTEEPYYHWMNTGLKAKGNLEFIYPGTKYIGHEGEHADWPVNKSNGKHISFYEENNFGGYKSYHVFGKYTNFFGAYWHDDDFGMVRFAPHDEKPGKKIWIWGLSGQGMIWEKLLTDTDGQYVEVQSGRLFNQNAAGSTFTPFKHRSFAPYETDTWKEYWYPVLHTGGIAKANEYGALNLKIEDGWLKVYFSPVQFMNDELQVTAGEKQLYSKKIKLSPLQVFRDSVKTGVVLEKMQVSIGGKKFNYDADPQADVLDRPVDAPASFDWNSAYGLFVQGKEWMDQKEYAKAEAKLDSSLKKDPDFYPALIQMSALLYRNMRYEEAHQLIRRALSIDTHAGDANYYYGLINAALGKTIDAKDGFDLATQDAGFRSPAYTGLATLYLKEKDYNRAMDYAAKAIDYNRFNISALSIEAVASRYLNQPDKATDILQQLLALDPLNHFAQFEQWLWKKDEATKTNFVFMIRNEMPRETFAELGVWYHDLGCDKDAEIVFSLSPASAEASCWLAFLRHQKVDCSKIDPNLVFTFRSETAGVIEQLLKSQDDWFLKYQLALVYKDRNREREAIQLLQACGATPDYAPFYAVRSILTRKSAPDASFTDLEKALQLGGDEWRYHKLMAEYYLDKGEYAKALPITTAFYTRHKDQYIMGMLQARALLLNEKYAEADALLTKLNVIPFEGATAGRELYREAKLMQALAWFKKKNYKKALAFVQGSGQWPENLGVGKPYDADIDLRMEEWINYLCYSKLRQTDKAKAELEKMVAFAPKVDNTKRNFVSANSLVTAWAYAALGRKEEGRDWLKAQHAAFPDDAVLSWSSTRFDNPTTPDYPDAAKEPNLRIVQQLPSSAE